MPYIPAPNDVVLRLYRTNCLNKPKQSLGKLCKKAGGTTLPHFSSMTIHNLFLILQMPSRYPYPERILSLS